VEDDVDVWRYAILELHARNDDDDEYCDWLECFVQQSSGWEDRLQNELSIGMINSTLSYTLQVTLNDI